MCVVTASLTQSHSDSKQAESRQKTKRYNRQIEPDAQLIEGGWWLVMPQAMCMEPEDLRSDSKKNINGK